MTIIEEALLSASLAYFIRWHAVPAPSDYRDGRRSKGSHLVSGSLMEAPDPIPLGCLLAQTLQGG